jgi:hypothetical protein
MCPHTTQCVLILMCLHTTKYVSSYCYMFRVNLNMYPHNAVCVLVLLYVSAYYY